MNKNPLLRLEYLLENKKELPTLKELKNILDNEEDLPIKTLPNGEIRVKENN